VVLADAGLHGARLSDRGPELVDFVTGAPTSSGSLDVRWRHGVRPGSGESEPPIQVHRFDEHTFILRQSKTVDFEAPFLYLFLGNERAVLFDTGTTPDPDRCPLRETVDELVAGWLAIHQRTAYGLVVVPMGLCLLPAFVVLTVVPLVLGLLGG